MKYNSSLFAISCLCFVSRRQVLPLFRYGEEGSNSRQILMINFPEEIVLLAKTSDVSVKHPVRLEKLMRFKNYHMFRDLPGK